MKSLPASIAWMEDLVCSQITEIKGEVARRKYPDRNQFTSSAHSMYALVDSELLNVPPEQD